MTPGEFKAWFDGFTEAFAGCPTKAQWTRIKARVAEIDGKPITHTVYLDRYLPSPSYPYWRYLTTGGIVGTTNSAVGQSYAQAARCNNINNQVGQNALTFNSSQAMADLGRVEASNLGAN